MTERDDGEKIIKHQSGGRLGKPVKNIRAYNRQASSGVKSHSREDRDTMPGKDSEEILVGANQADTVASGSAYETGVTDRASSVRYAYKTVPYAIIEMLNHRSEKVRVEAIESLLKIGDKSLGYAFTNAIG